MECEICGTDIKGNSIRVIVEGTVLDVCSKCAHYGKPQDKWTPVSRKMAPTERVIVTHRPKRDAFDKLEDEILPDYAQVLKNGGYVNAGLMGKGICSNYRFCLRDRYFCIFFNKL